MLLLCIDRQVRIKGSQVRIKSPRFMLNFRVYANWYVCICFCRILLKIHFTNSFADKWLKCFRRAAKNVCNEDGIKFLEWVVDPYISDALDLGCKKEWTFGSEKCTQSINQIGSNIKNSSLPAASKSILLPLYKMLAEFAEDQDLEDVSAFLKKSD